MELIGYIVVFMVVLVGYHVQKNYSRSPAHDWQDM